MKQRPVLMDGAAGTTLWQLAEAAGIEKAPVWTYNLAHPALVRELHRRYIAAGSQLIQANTFGANGPAVRHFSSDTVSAVVTAGVRLAKEAAAGTGVTVAAAFGPLTSLLEPYGDTTEAECRAVYTEMLEAAVAAGPDVIILETFIDVNMMQIAAAEAKRYGLPVLCSMTFGGGRRTVMGNSVADIVEALSPLGIDGIGTNCSLGPAEALEVLRAFREQTALPLFFKPNAGKPIFTPGGGSVSACPAAQFARAVAPAFDIAAYVGGCCGCDDTYVEELKKLL